MSKIGYPHPRAAGAIFFAPTDRSRRDTHKKTDLEILEDPGWLWRNQYFSSIFDIFSVKTSRNLICFDFVQILFQFLFRQSTQLCELRRFTLSFTPFVE